MPCKKECVPYTLLQCSLLNSTSWKLFQISNCGVCSSWYSIHLPKSPTDGPLIAAEVNTLCTPVYLCTLRREPQTREHMFSVSATLEATWECMCVCTISTPNAPCPPSVVTANRWNIFQCVEKPFMPFSISFLHKVTI